MKKTKKGQAYQDLSNKGFSKKLAIFIYRIFGDVRAKIKNGKKFNEYGLTLYCGRQGAGKTMAMTEYLERMRKEYPDAIICTNYGYVNQSFPLEDWKQIFQIRNGDKGVIFAIDEIQNEFNSDNWRNFPEGLLAEVTQQRKQKIKIVGTSQVFTRVVKQLREQTFEVVDCRTFAGRWTFTKAFDAFEYNAAIDSPLAKSKLQRLWRRNFVQSDELRDLYDSYAKIEKMIRGYELN